MRWTALTVFVAIVAALCSAGCRRNSAETQPAPSGETGTPDRSPGGKPATPGKNENIVPKSTDVAKGLSKESLLGEWEGTLKDGTTVALLFNGELVAVSILSPGTNREKAREAAEYVSGGLGRALGGGGFGIGSTTYEIDAAKNEVKIWGKDAWGGVAKPTKDGALLVSGDLKIGTVPETRLERAKK